MLMTTTATNSRMVCSARSGTPCIARMRSMLMETATKTRPASAAAAPAEATNSSCHSVAS